MKRSKLFGRGVGSISVIVTLVLVLTIGSAQKAAAQQQSLTLPTNFHFDGTSYITLPNSPALQPTSQITITAWIKPDFGAGNVVDTILDKRDGCGFNRSYQLGLIKGYAGYTPGTIFFAASNANTDDLISSTPVPNDGKFHHVAGKYDGASTKIFLDGVLVGQGTHSGPISITTDPPVIGIQAGCNDPTYADIGNIRISNYAVPDDHIMSDTPAEFASLNGSNSFVGDQNVNGVISATHVVGDGSGLTNLSPTNITAGTANININGAAVSALNAATAANAANSSNLGGIPAGNYARVDAANSFAGNQNIQGNVASSGNISAAGTLVIGGGTPVVRHLSMTFNPPFPLLKVLTCVFTTYSFPGVDDGDAVALGVPNSRYAVGGILIYTAYAVAPNTLQFRACNVDASNKQTIAATGTIRVDVWKH